MKPGFFSNREEAGRALAEALERYKGNPDVVVLGIPRGGVVVAAKVAEELGAPLDVVISHKIGAPGNPELAIGAITSTGLIVLDDELLSLLNVPESYLDAEIERQRQELEKKLRYYRQGRDPLPIEDKVVIVVDDGIATGSTMVASLRALKRLEPRKLIVAVPVAPMEAEKRVMKEADEVVVLLVPASFWAVGAYYGDFRQVSDEEVVSLLEKFGKIRNEKGD